MAKVGRLYINYASTILLERSKHDFIEYKNKLFPNNSYIQLRACDSVSSYHFTSPITESNIPKRDRILHCCYDRPRTNAPYLEPTEQLDCLFPASLHKIILHIFKNISKF